MDVFEVMDTCRAMRRLKTDPVPKELLERLVHAATRAPSAGNSQLWGFLVLTEDADKRFLAEIVQGGGLGRREPEGDDPQSRLLRAVRYLVNHLAEAPAIILPCVEDAYPDADVPNPVFMWSTIYPATQNLLLAARALGLGAAMTTFHIIDEPRIKEHFGIPQHVHIAATIPVGYPLGRFGPLSRKPVDEVMHWGRWGRHE